MSIAENVANAAKEGGFLGIGGTRVSDGEIKAFAEIANALGTSSLLTSSRLVFSRLTLSRITLSC